jgi:hypothetical protein
VVADVGGIAITMDVQSPLKPGHVGCGDGCKWRAQGREVQN